MCAAVALARALAVGACTVSPVTVAFRFGVAVSAVVTTNAYIRSAESSGVAGRAVPRARAAGRSSVSFCRVGSRLRAAVGGVWVPCPTSDAQSDAQTRKPKAKNAEKTARGRCGRGAGVTRKHLSYFFCVWPLVSSGHVCNYATRIDPTRAPKAATPRRLTRGFARRCAHAASRRGAHRPWARVLCARVPPMPTRPRAARRPADGARRRLPRGAT